MDRNEIEREILDACGRVEAARARYEKLYATEDVIRNVSGYSANEAKAFREAKEMLAERVHQQAMDQDHLWRKVIEGAADRIYTELRVAQGLVKEQRDLLKSCYNAIRERAINYGDYEDLIPDLEQTLGIEPENPAETKGDLDFHNDREEGRG
jgi:hypothetical protein